VKRGEVRTASAGNDDVGKPRPVVILQDDIFDATASITVCAFTTDTTQAPLFRLHVEPSERNGLQKSCSLMVDKITTVSRSKLGGRIGHMDDGDLIRLNQAVIVFLGLSMSPRRRQKC
jgi:mRNA interferase MazF